MSAGGNALTTVFQLPHRVTRKLRRGPWLRRARNLLIVANGCSRTVRGLNRSRSIAAGIDDGPHASDAETANVHFGSVAGGFPFPPHAFDLVLLGPCQALQRGLSGPEPFIAMANLLSSLKTSGRLIWLKGDDATHPTGDDIENGLSQFSVDVTVQEYHDGWERYLSLEWLIGRHRDVRLQLTTLTVPRKPISRLAWHQLARDAALNKMQAQRQDRAA